MTENLFPSNKTENKPITVLGKTFGSEDERRTYFREELRKKLPELKQMEGFPIGEDEDIINLSDPPYYTACPNPWLNDLIAEWEEEKKEMEKQGLRSAEFEVNAPYPEDIKSGKNHAIYNAHSYHTKVPHEITTKFLFYYSQPGDIIIDTFAGTGMTGVGGSFCENITQEQEAITRIKSDFATFKKEIAIGKRKVINIDLSSVASHISNIYNSDFDKNSFLHYYSKLKSHLEQFKEYFEVEHHNAKGTINYTVYSQLYTCNQCQTEFDFYIAAYVSDNELREKTKCPHCSYEEQKSKLTPLYKTKIDPITGDAINQICYKPILINYSNNKKRFTKAPSTNDIKRSEADFIDKKFVPNASLIEGVETRRNDKYGYTHVHHFYTSRTLGFISEYLKFIQDFDHKNHFLFLLTAILPKLTKLNRYMPQHGSRALVGPMANTLYLPPLFVENNFIDQMEFQFKKITKALEVCSRQTVSQQSATDLSNIKNDSIDYVFIDPPFGANIMYSELNNISEAWLQVLTNNKEEAIESKGQNKGKFEYDNLMVKSFGELYRIMKPNAWMTIEFSNTSSAIWNIIQNGINRVGFIVAKVDALNKTRGGLHAMLGPVAVKQDLVITCYKPSTKLVAEIYKKQDVWSFILEHLNHLPIYLSLHNSTTAIIERSPKILFDRLISFYVQRSLPVPIDAGKFQQGLRERFIERDGMFFTHEQAAEYEKKKAEVPNFIQLSIFVASEQDAIYWLRNILDKAPKTEQDLHPLWMKEVATNMRKGDNLPEMRTILEENFLKDDAGKWYVPDAENEADLEKLRNRRLMKIFEDYRAEASKPKGKLKEVRVEALRAGFKQCYQDKDFTTIVTVGDRIPNNLLMEDEVLLQFYDIAVSRV
ncbi:DNA methylase [Marnyiella aurantia]|uniref:DNA methylase n=1 Tax=Marnyiella aurantia TaxID=2758037 RepID=A0A7D7LSD0_9FLAO|nr:DNA methylase [Marnyiella aurantia]MBA5245904.1 DNA methylase [Marnyiella aurantia]QMS98697.1 DNA methylase [Marnyiella aurantia]